MIVDFNSADILEDTLNTLYPDAFNLLLKDHTRSTKEEQVNIFWATNDYVHLGNGYEAEAPITTDLITKENGHTIMPRILKTKDTQFARSKEMAEVFTPSWICNQQNNLIDEAWFGRKDVFNTESINERGEQVWQQTNECIEFPEGKTWKDYVRDVRLEITCGEAPYLVSRYDTTTGEQIPIEKRIGLLDRKLRVINENVDNSTEWLKWAQTAYRSIYGYEWQGDNLLLAREALLISFIEYFQHKFNKSPREDSVKFIAYIISWNIWQMDGLKGVIPNSCKDTVVSTLSLFGDEETKKKPCEGCAKDEIRKHTGIYCLIKDWKAKDPKTGMLGKRIRFIDIIK